jgi:phosphate-selective porin OprO and OprP
LEREEKLKVSLAGTYSYNESALRQGGQLGNDLFGTRDINNYSADLLLKYSGWAWYSEFSQRAVDNPITVNPTNALQLRTLYDGYGVVSQVSRLFKNNYELAGRYAITKPSSSLYNNINAPSLNEKQAENYELGVTKYLNGHRLKVQSGVVYSKLTDLRTNSFFDGTWSWALQFELGI